MDLYGYEISTFYSHGNGDLQQISNQSEETELATFISGSLVVPNRALEQFKVVQYKQGLKYGQDCWNSMADCRSTESPFPNWYSWLNGLITSDFYSQRSLHKSGRKTLWNLSNVSRISKGIFSSLKIHSNLFTGNFPEDHKDPNF